MKDTKLETLHTVLKLTYGLVPLLAGLDKFIGLLADWEGYLSPSVAALLPVSPSTFMGLVGVIEIAVGLAILTRFTHLGAYVAMGWLIAISLNLVLAGAFDVAVRDLVMAVGAFTLAQLAAVRAEAPAASPAGHAYRSPA